MRHIGFEGTRHTSRPALAAALAAAFLSLANAALLRAASATPAHESRRAERPTPKPIDYKQITAEATQLLSKYIQINTTNPPGNEMAAATMLREKFLADGIPAKIWETKPGRAVIAARLHGMARHKKAIILLSHMDVVPADPKDWAVPPFSGEVKDGEIWGRGALDDKGPGVVEMMAMLAIKRSGILLDRDVLFLATADEEAGGQNGAGWLVEHEPDVIRDAAWVLNEGGEIRAEPGLPKLYEVSTSDKTPLWLRVTTEGTPGHASAPPEQTAVTRLLRALSRVMEYRTSVKVLPIVENYFHLTTEIDHGPRPLLDLRSALRDPAFARQFLSQPGQAAMVRDTITPTVLSASAKVNVIPAAAYAELDCRLLPGDSADRMLRGLRRLIGDNKIRIDPFLNFPAISSPEKSELMTAIETLAARHDKARVVPTLEVGFTDSHYFREHHLVAYGFIPLEATREEARTVHGANERIGISNLQGGIERMVELLKILGGAR